jgi:hypothetical protein
MISNETLRTVMIIEFVSERKKFILVSACWKLSQEILEGIESGLARISGFSLSEFRNTKRNGVT